MSGHGPLHRYGYMKLARELDERFEKLLLTGRISKWYSEVGNEATTVAAGLAMEPGDALCTLHRDLGAILAVYLDPARTFPELGGTDDETRPEPQDLLYTLACQLLGKADGFSSGVERSFHYGYLAPERGILHVGMISHLGSMIPVAAGCAFALRRQGESRVAVNFIGEGGTSTGDFHEGLNMAAVWKLPLILVIENNRYAFSTPANLQYAASSLADRGLGYGIPAEVVDGNDPEAMSGAMERAVARARAGEGPTLIEAMLGRMRGHSQGDDSLKVVPEADLEAYRRADPVAAYADSLLRNGLADQSRLDALDRRIDDLIEDAVGRALEASPPLPETAHRPVFAPAPDADPEPPEPNRGDETSYVDAVHSALVHEMEHDDSVVLMGQDIGVFEGAFRVTRGMHARWPDRVLDTPIAESGTVGIAIGAGLLGWKTVVEMQFADFVTCAFNQLVNVAAKLYYRWEVPCPIVIRLPSGGGVGAGPFHSQNPEGWFAHVPGLKVVCPATAADARGLLVAAIRDPNPVIFCEHKYLYRRIKEVLPAAVTASEIGKAAIRRSGDRLTMVGYGVSLWTCLEAAQKLSEEGIECEVLDLRTIWPLDEAAIVESVRRTGRLLIVHEATRTGGFGAEVAARVADAAFDWLDAPVRRVTHSDRPSPFAKVLEQELLPSTERVVATARELLVY